MKNLLFLLLLLPNVILAQSVNAERLIMGAAFSSFMESRNSSEQQIDEQREPALSIGTWKARFKIAAYNSRKDDNVFCEFSLSYYVLSDEMSIERNQNGNQVYNKLSCAKGFTIKSITSTTNSDSIDITVDWRYNSPETREKTVFTSSHSITPYHSYMTPVDKEYGKADLSINFYEGITIDNSEVTLVENKRQSL